MDDKMKSKNRTVSANDSDWEEVQAAAKRAGIPTSRWVMSLALTAARQRTTAKKGGK
jgi:hypothetical protein